MGIAVDEENKTTGNIVGNMFMVGGKINLHRRKFVFLSLAVGYQNSFFYIGRETIDASDPTIGAGLGCRISFSSKDCKKD